jgi:hypothetical protein
MRMKLFKTKVWSAQDIILLKWCCLLFGLVFGSYLSSFIKRHVGLFTIIAILLSIKPAITYFSGEEAQKPS